MRIAALPLFAIGALLIVSQACGGSDDAVGDPSNTDPDGANPFGADATAGDGATGPDVKVPGKLPDGAPIPETEAGPEAECVGSADDPTAAATISGYMDTLPNNAPSGAVRDEIIDAVIRACHVYAPRQATAPGFAREYCWAQLTASMLKESSYNAALTIKDSYGMRSVTGGTANDPTVGLLQVRFSSTVHDYVALGNRTALTCVGCTLPAGLDSHKNESGDSSFWAVTGPTANLTTMKDRACNIGLGAWYYYLNATANGKPSGPTYLSAYCGGGGTAAHLVTGLLSHLKGPSGANGVLTPSGVNALQNTDNYAYTYVTTIQGWFDTMVGPVAGTHPFFILMQPNSAQYCE